MDSDFDLYFINRYIYYNYYICELYFNFKNHLNLFSLFDFKLTL